MLIVGAGPAGTAAAITLTRSGRSVLVVDKASFPRDKICGDGLTTSALRHLEGLGVEPHQIDSWFPVHDVVVRAPYGVERRFSLPRGQGRPKDASSKVIAVDHQACILCDRCTRFAKDVAGDTLIHFQDRGNGTQVNTFPDHPFASYFSGNTVQICPVGALTAKPYRFKARPWDLDVVESTCTGCSVGCRIVVDASRNEVLRYVGVDSDPVNWSWLCDKGRFGFEAIGADGRLAAPLAKDASGTLAETRWSDALAAAARAIKAGLDRSGPAGTAVIGGSRLTNESAYAWAKLAKGLIGTDSVDAQLGDGLVQVLLVGGKALLEPTRNVLHFHDAP